MKKKIKNTYPSSDNTSIIVKASFVGDHRRLQRLGHLRNFKVGGVSGVETGGSAGFVRGGSGGIGGGFGLGLGLGFVLFCFALFCKAEGVASAWTCII